MAQESVTIFSDTVIKLSINQGLEEQRTQETLGSFTMGELAFTRDTGRVFVGDNSDNIGEHEDLQSTIGGILVGNKYLGIIDSKPLAIFSDNSTPLSYEENTHFSGSQELPSMEEKALLKEESKFRNKSKESAKNKWSTWPREAQYNKEYNAYNGDYMFDPYQSAFIFFDSRISGDENSDTQPVVKKDEFGEPVSPETFIVDGEEIASSDPRAVDIKRRTKTINYIVNGEDKPAFPIYGNGYVISRILEPDNKTIKLRKRSFDNNGEPIDGNNISHNILEIGSISTSNIDNVFGDDFVVDELVSLNKKLKDIVSITSPETGLKTPQNIIFSTPSDTRNATGTMKWSFLTPDYMEFDIDKQYELVLSYTGDEQDADFYDNEYPAFNVQLKEKIEKVQTYYIHLGNGLISERDHSKTLVLNENATSNDSFAPMLALEESSEEGLSEKYVEYTDPYNSEKEENFDTVYSSNFGISEGGNITTIDEYNPNYYKACKDIIDKWEGQNPTLNFIRKPITILSSSSDSSLFDTNETSGQNLGVTTYVDFFVNPYVYCGRKIVSSNSTTLLPELTNIDNYPGKTGSTYFDSFNNINIKTWNSLVCVLGNNHYKSLSNNVSKNFFIDGVTGDHTKTDSVSGKVFKTIQHAEYDDSYAPVSRKDLEEVAVFGWIKTEIEDTTTWEVIDKFDNRTSSDIDFYGTEISKISIDGKTNIIDNSNDGIVEVSSESDGIKTTKRFLMPESSLLSGIPTKIVYGTDDWEYEFDLIKKSIIQYTTNITMYQNEEGKWTNDNDNEITSIELVTTGNTKTTINENNVKTFLDSNNGKLDIDGSYNSTNFKDLKMIVFVSTDNEGNSVKNYHHIANGVYYVVGASLPSTIQNAKIKESNFQEVTVDETIQEENKIVLPNHAQSIILEIEHKTTDNSPIAVFYANEFNQLGLILSGLTTKEASDNTSFSNASLKDSVYTLANGVYKQNMGASLAADNSSFHSLDKSIEENKLLTPSCFYSDENEKPVFLSNVSETRLIEIPLHKSNYNSLKHFALRISNIKPTTGAAKNSIALRVIGYRV